MAAASFPFILVSVYTCDALPALQLLIDLCHVDLYTYIRKYIWIYKEILYNLAFGPPSYMRILEIREGQKTVGHF